MTQLLLASKSPRRRELLSQLGIAVAFVDIDVDERLPAPVAADCVAEQTALLKAAGYRRPLGFQQVLVTADTVVVCQGQVLGKPHSREEASEMLHRLSGRTHEVYTGVCLRTATGQRSFSERTEVEFRTLSDREIDHYIATCRPYDKAGAYGIQEWIGMIGIRAIKGCYYNVMGLPLARLYAELSELLNTEGAR